jgi:hypothetical protein
MCIDYMHYKRDGGVGKVTANRNGNVAGSKVNLNDKNLGDEFVTKCKVRPVPMAARSRARTVFDRSNIGIVGSYPARGIYMCVSAFFCVVLACVDRGLASG